MNPTPNPASGSATLAATVALLESQFPARLVSLGPSPAGMVDTSVSVRECGQGPTTVVLLHGIGSGAASWFHTATKLAKALPVRVVAWDAPGYGDSVALPIERPTARHYAERLSGLVQALEIRSCVLVGHSLGALTASAYAHGLGAEVVQRLVLISPAGGYGAPEQAEASQRVRTERLATLDGAGISGMAEAAGKPGTRMLSAAAPEDARDWVRWNMGRLHPHGYRQAIELLCGDSLLRYAPVRMPVEVHCGDQDVVTPPAGCEAVAKAFSASFAPIPGAGHAGQIEQSSHVAHILAAAAGAR